MNVTCKVFSVVPSVYPTEVLGAKCGHWSGVHLSKRKDRKSPLSKQRLPHWLVDVITMAYSQSGHPAPTVTCQHSRSVFSSWAFLRCILLQQVHTFSRFYKDHITLPSGMNLMALSEHHPHELWQVGQWFAPLLVDVRDKQKRPRVMDEAVVSWATR